MEAILIGFETGNNNRFMDNFLLYGTNTTGKATPLASLEASLDRTTKTISNKKIIKDHNNMKKKQRGK